MFKVPKPLCHVRWFGLGPGEAYSDSFQAQHVGLFKSSVDGLFTNYVRPQENGNRHDVRRMAVTDDKGAGLVVAGEPRFDFTVSNYTMEMLDGAQHPNLLEEDDAVNVFIDLGQTGLGSGSCGPKPRPEYQLQAKDYRFRFRIHSVAPGELDDTTFFQF